MDWNEKPKRLLKSELIKRGITNSDLVLLLKEIDIEETKASIDSKISRGTFSASFFMQCLFVIGCTKIEIEEYHSTFLFPESSNLLVAEPNVKYKTVKDEN
jgi:hypothetical protein